MFNYLIFVLLGILIGIITGLVPGFHPNLLATFLLNYLFFPPFESTLIMISAGVTNSFLNFIPAIYLGAPSADTALSVLPGHKFLLNGRGYEAIRLTVLGGLSAIFLFVISLPLIFNIVPAIYPYIEANMALILVIIVIYMFTKDNDINAILIFLLSGMLGYLVLEYNFIGTRYDLFPLLSGLFGISILFNSVRRDPKIPEQNRSMEHTGRKNLISGGIIGYISGLMVGILPGIGSAQATYLTQEISGDRNERRFMIGIGGVNTSNIIFSLIAVYLIGKPRSGIAVAVQDMISNITFSTLIVFIAVLILSAGIGALITLFISKRAIKVFRKINYRLLCILIIFFILGMSLLVTGPKGLIVCLLGSLLGYSSLLADVRRSYLMGSIILPVIIFFI